MNIPNEAIDAALLPVTKSFRFDVQDLDSEEIGEWRDFLRGVLEAAAPIIAAQVSADVTRLARWLMDADITESLEVLDILAEGDLSKAITRIEADS